VFRSIGVAEVLADVPAGGVALAGLLTQLGDTWFLAVALAGVYLAGRRGSTVVADAWADSLFLVAVALAAAALTVGLKAVFGLPRPPGATTAAVPALLPPFAGALYTAAVTGHGFGFPSGHALLTTAVYLAAALRLRIGTSSQRLAVATGVVALVSTTRLVLGVHYLVDVLAGVLVGAILVAALRSTVWDSPGRTLLIALGLGIGALLLARSLSSLAILASTLVASSAWWLSSRSDRAARIVGA
jgi:membrane-associated phospholipid phosphatase